MKTESCGRYGRLKALPPYTVEFLRAEHHVTLSETGKPILAGAAIWCTLAAKLLNADHKRKSAAEKRKKQQGK